MFHRHRRAERSQPTTTRRSNLHRIRLTKGVGARSDVDGAKVRTAGGGVGLICHIWATLFAVPSDMAGLCVDDTSARHANCKRGDERDRQRRLRLVRHDVFQAPAERLEGASGWPCGLCVQYRRLAGSPGAARHRRGHAVGHHSRAWPACGRGHGHLRRPERRCRPVQRRPPRAPLGPRRALDPQSDDRLRKPAPRGAPSGWRRPAG